ncbi:MAG: tetraacyldisaccharide 4'-kinase [Bacteroidales bacterium]
MKSFFLNRVILAPYYFILACRNYLYDKGIFKSYSFDIPIISVGNISAGGTGKTPHTEFLVKRMIQERRVAVLSRGYGRKSRGFRYVECSDSVRESGDEPLQIKRKFPEAIVVVDGNRVRAIGKLLELPPDQRPEVIILDDAFQHRRVIPSCNIVLIDHSNPPLCDNLLPFGTLRDLPSQLRRADILLVTKSPPQLSLEEQFRWRETLLTKERQKLFFTALNYCDAEPLFKEGDRRYIYSRYAQLVTAIANPIHLENQLSSSYKIIKRIRYRDHKEFKRRDVATINRISQKEGKAIIITTEKDAQRLFPLERRVSLQTRERLFYLPIEVTFLNDSESDFIESIFM